MSPVVFHYANILFLSLIALIPTQTWQILRADDRRRRGRQRDLFDRHSAVRVHAIPSPTSPTGLLTASFRSLCYAAGLVVGATFSSRESTAGLDLLAGAALLLLVINIRNAWDLMISLARAGSMRSAENRPKLECRDAAC